MPEVKKSCLNCAHLDHLIPGQCGVDDETCMGPGPGFDYNNWIYMPSYEETMQMIQEKLVPIITATGCSSLVIAMDGPPKAVDLLRTCLEESGIEWTEPGDELDQVVALNEPPSLEEMGLELSEVLGEQLEAFLEEEEVEPLVEACTTPPVKPEEIKQDNLNQLAMMPPVPRHDPVEHPQHYTDGKVECWDWYELGMTDDEYRGAMKSNIFKYVHRYRSKGGIEDLKKAAAYLGRLIQFERGERMFADRAYPTRGRFGD